MNPNLSLDFFADKANNSLKMTRKFLAPRQLVWDCFTKSELLDQWYAPKPLTVKTKSMDFRPGGHWHYVMTEQNGTEYWNFVEFITIKPIDTYTVLDSFSNEAGEINKELPRAEWRINFIDKGEELTMVETVVKYGSLSDLETVIEMGVQEGVKLTYDNLDVILEGLL